MLAGRVRWKRLGIALLVLHGCGVPGRHARPPSQGQHRTVAAEAPISWQPVHPATSTGGHDAAAEERERRQVVALLRRRCVGVSESLRQSRLRYERWVSWDAGPTGAERHVHGTYAVNWVDDCTADLAQVPGVHPDAELAQVIGQFAASMTSLGQTVDDTANYYEQRRHEEDGFARGRQLHQALRAGFQHHAPIDRAFLQLFRRWRRRSDALLLARLAATEEVFPLALRVERVRVRADDLGELAGCLTLDPRGIPQCNQRDDFVTGTARLQEAQEELEAALQQDDRVNLQAQSVDLDDFVEKGRVLSLRAEQIVRWMRDGRVLAAIDVGYDHDPLRLRETYRDLLFEYLFLKHELGHLDGTSP